MLCEAGCYPICHGARFRTGILF